MVLGEVLWKTAYEFGFLKIGSNLTCEKGRDNMLSRGSGDKKKKKKKL